ncbi:TIGR03086 family metal-binding protein [Skermania sp. ID1734]|uniref:TIGR03086 family metal-binding protein n=1 Tax=Skermania sp. ID1734 TaxID=2597516 RepID=UPI00163D6E32|nr:TIGR03086 family metal-binding protein [Skermania sp. ID1734]
MVDATDLAALDRATQQFSEVLASLGPDDLSQPSACDGWDVRDVANHVCGGALRYAHYLRGGMPDEIAWTRTADNAGDDPRAAHDQLSRELRTLFAQPSADTIRAHHPVQTVSGTELLYMRVEELAIHAWDISGALDASATIDEPLAAYILDRGTEVLRIQREHGYFAGSKAIGDDAPAAARLLALTGRAPRYQASNIRASNCSKPTKVIGMDEPTVRNRSPYQSTALSLMRVGVLDALHDLLLERRWTSITMNDVAKAAGVSRGTLYNEFQSRIGLARSYALRLTDSVVAGIEREIYRHPGDGHGALCAAFGDFFSQIGHDPLVRALRAEDAPNDLLRMITVESQFIVDHASRKFSRTFQESWIGASKLDADIMGEAVVRTALSFLALPPISPEVAAEGVAQLLTPFLTATRLD